jgi:hypothetical protein
MLGLLTSIQQKRHFPGVLYMILYSLLITYRGITEERLQGSSCWRQEEENRFFALYQAGLKPLNLFRKNQKYMYFETCSVRNTASLLNPLNLFMGMPSASCLLNYLSPRLTSISSDVFFWTKGSMHP